MNRHILEKICDPNISILQNIIMLRENWLKYKDLDNAVLNLHPSTYDRLMFELATKPQPWSYEATKYEETILGLPIKQDPRLRPYHLLIREEDNMEIDIDRDRDSITINENMIKFFAEPSNECKGKLPTRYIINDGAVILFWSDGDKTIVKRAEDDIFDPVKGFLWAYFQKYSGLSKTKANKYLRDIDKENEPTLTIHIDNANLSSFIKNIFKED